MEFTTVKASDNNSTNKSIVIINQLAINFVIFTFSLQKDLLFLSICIIIIKKRLNNEFKHINGCNFNIPNLRS